MPTAPLPPLARGDLVAVALPPGPAWAPLVGRVWGAEAALLPIDPRLPPAGGGGRPPGARPAQGPGRRRRRAPPHRRGLLRSRRGDGGRDLGELGRAPP